jgi:hypothetical protein
MWHSQLRSPPEPTLPADDASAWWTAGTGDDGPGAMRCSERASTHLVMEVAERRDRSVRDARALGEVALQGAGSYASHRDCGELWKYRVSHGAMLEGGEHAAGGPAFGGCWGPEGTRRRRVRLGLCLCAGPVGRPPAKSIRMTHGSSVFVKQIHALDAVHFMHSPPLSRGRTVEPARTTRMKGPVWVQV